MMSTRPRRRSAFLWLAFLTLAIAVVGALSAAGSAAAAVGKGIWLTQAEIQALPTSGPAWQSVKAAADGNLGTPSIANQDSDHDVNTLAVALVYARTADPAYRTKAANAIMSAVGTETGGRTLALGRNLVSYVVAADLINLAEYDAVKDSQFRGWLSTVRTKVLDGKTLLSTHAERANNWGTNAGASRIAADAYLGDVGDLSSAVRVFRGWLGDRAQYAGFSFGDLAWQADSSRPVGINPLGARKSGYNIDGVLPDDQRRGGGFAWPAPKENYVWGGLGPAVVQAELLHRAGFTSSYAWSDQALKRAVIWLHEVNGFPASGDDRWAPWLANFAYATTYPASTGTIGKSMAWTDWTHARTRGTSAAPLPTPAPAPLPTAAPAPQPTTQPPPAPPPQPTPTQEPPPASAGALRTFTPTADAHVFSGQPAANYGTFTRVRASTAYRAYLTFTVSGLSGPASLSKLRLYVTDPSPEGGTVYIVTAPWSESTVSWTAAPALVGGGLATIPAQPSGTWVEVNLPSFVTGNGTYSLAITSGSSDFVAYSSREGKQAPQLVVTAA